jgi:two-component sensor histidine kinase
LAESTLLLEGWPAQQVLLALEAGGVALWTWNVDTDRFSMDARAFGLWAVPTSETVTFDELSGKIHPADRDRVRAGFSATRSIHGPYEIDFRIMIDKEVRWISARGQGSDAGIVGRTMLGIFLDVTGRKQVEDAHELLAGELSHRVKNLLAIAAGLAALTSRSTETATDMARELTQRLTALGRAHDLVRPLPGEETKDALLGDLISVLLAPYDDMGAFSGRVRVSVPRMAVSEASATTLALVIHELATNSLKYGALSSDAGTLDLSCAPHPTDMVLVWTERGGPTVKAPTGKGGFGSNLINRAVATQLGGTISRQWIAEGGVVALTVQKDRLSR